MESDILCFVPNQATKNQRAFGDDRTTRRRTSMNQEPLTLPFPTCSQVSCWRLILIERKFGTLVHNAAGVASRSPGQATRAQPRSTALGTGAPKAQNADGVPFPDDEHVVGHPSMRKAILPDGMERLQRSENVGLLTHGLPGFVRAVHGSCPRSGNRPVLAARVPRGWHAPVESRFTGFLAFRA